MCKNIGICILSHGQVKARGAFLAAIDGTDQGWGAVHLGCKMDLEAYVHDLGFVDYNAGTEMCGLCLANRSNVPCFDFREAAA